MQHIVIKTYNIGYGELEFNMFNKIFSLIACTYSQFL